MSIDYNAKYGFGFIITEEDLHHLGPEKRDKMIDSEFFHCIDGLLYQCFCVSDKFNIF